MANLKINIMIMVKISAWGSLNLQYLYMRVASQKGLEALRYIEATHRGDVIYILQRMLEHYVTNLHTITL